MNQLINIIDVIEDIAKDVPNVNQVVKGDVYQLNELPDVKYSVVAVTQNQHRVDDDYRYYNLNIFYVDRLTHDEDNRLQIQSHGLEVLEYIIGELSDKYSVIASERQFQVFTERFSSLCAGVHVQVTVQVNNVVCL